MRRLLRWIFLTGPCRLYLLGEASGGSVPYTFVAGLFGTAAAFGGVFALIAAMAGASVEDYFFTGVLTGLLTVTAWAAYAFVVYGVLWLRGISPAAVVSAHTSTEAKPASSRPADDPHWRHPGGPVIRRGLIAFFALMTAVFLAAGIFTTDQGPFDTPLARTTATILRYDDGPAGLGERLLEVRFTADGREYTTEVKAEDYQPETRIPPPGGSLEIEYVPSNPTQARPAGTTQANKSDATFTRTLAIASAALTLLTAAAHLISRRRRGRS
ncbi:hypothetical protein [Kribbella sp. NPDC051770]|uniref:hypothetical protein n=1 Tax=Kribbella sp. NPDC051770 TaxID=3155413 RepID=UPI00344990FF